MRRWVACQLTVASPKRSSVFVQSRESTARAGKPRADSSSARIGALSRSPNESTESSICLVCSFTQQIASRRTFSASMVASTDWAIRCAVAADGPRWLASASSTARALERASSPARSAMARAGSLCPRAARRAASMSESVVSPMAETTTASGPWAWCLEMRSMTRSSRSGEPTDEPPNFITRWAACGILALLFRGFQRLRQIGNQVLDVLDADREADEVFADPNRQPLLGRQLVKGHQSGLLDERFDPSQRRGDRRQEAGVYHARGLVQPAADQKAHHSAEPPHLLARDLVVGVTFEARVVDALDRWVALEPAGYLERALVLAADAQIQRLHPSQEQVSAVGIQRSAQDAAKIAKGTDDSRLAADRPGEKIVVAAEVLGARVEHQVDAKFQRPLIGRRRKRRVDQQLHPRVAVADLGQLLEIGDAKVRIGRRLGDDEPRPFGKDRRFQRRVIPRLHQCGRHLVAGEDRSDEL